MSKQREKKVLRTGKMTKDDAERSFSQYNKAYAKITKIKAEIDLETNKIRDKYQKEINALEESKNEAFDSLQYFAESNEEYFKDKKTLEMSHGKVGFRTSPHKLKPLRGFTWDRVIEKLGNIMPDFIRTKQEVDKESLLSNRDNDDVAKNFKSIGVEIVQDETFFVDPKTEEVAA